MSNSRDPLSVRARERQAPIFAEPEIPGRPAGRARVIARAGALAALAVPATAFAAAPAAASTGVPDFGTATKLTSIGGDSALAHVATAARGAGKRLGGADILGDGIARPFATGSVTLVNDEGLKDFINTNITFSTSSSGSAAMSEADFTHAVQASTSAGGMTAETLNDAYDGYNELCLAVDNSAGTTCETGNANFDLYNKTGAPPTADASCIGPVSSVARQYDFPDQTLDGVTVSRKVFVPDNDHFARWMNIITNPGSSPVTVTPVIATNLGSDANTIITADSAGDTTPTAADTTWMATFQNFSGGNTSTDPRNGHILAGTGAATPLAGLHVVNGDDNPFWGYTLTIPPGATRIIMNYAVAEPTKAEAASMSAALAAETDAHQFDCMTPDEKAEVANFPIGLAAAPDSFSTPQGTALTSAAPGVLSNDQLASQVTASLVTGPADAASFALNPDGSFSYTPAPGFSGQDTFTYETVNPVSGGHSTPTTVTIDVVAAPAPPVTAPAPLPPPPHVCTSRRNFVVHLRFHLPSGVHLKGTKITGAMLLASTGKSVHKTPFTSSSATVDLRGLPKGVYRVRLTLRTASGHKKTITLTLPYQTC